MSTATWGRNIFEFSLKWAVNERFCVKSVYVSNAAGWPAEFSCRRHQRSERGVRFVSRLFLSPIPNISVVIWPPRGLSCGTYYCTAWRDKELVGFGRNLDQFASHHYSQNLPSENTMEIFIIKNRSWYGESVRFAAEMIA